MYASYYYNASSTAANILADVVAILTGETNKANLSENCDQTNTSINASVTVAGWSVYDASAGTNAICIRAAVADNASQYKYMVIDTNSANYIKFKSYEDWNSSTHAGTNLAYQSDNSTYHAQRVNVTLGGRLEITASARHAIFFSYQNSVWGNQTSTGWSGVLERTRRSPWDTVANGYPPFASVNSFYYSYECRSVGASGADVTGNPASVSLTHALGMSSGTPPTNPSTKVPIDAAKNLGHLMLPLGVYNLANGHLGGDITSLCDIWLTTYNNGATYDTLVYNGNTYIIWAISTSWRIAIRLG